MSKQKDQKRKAQLSEKAKNESFKFQVEYARQQRGTFIAADAPELRVEVDAICQNGLVDALLALRDIVDGVRREFGIEPENERCSLNGAIVPYLLGITTVCPDSADTYVPGLFLGEYPLQVVVAYHRLHRLHRFYAERNFGRLHRFFAFLAKAHPNGLKSRHDSNL